uniref:Uncharacterized protein n=1 Tax=Rhizophora mucronata TaxID=61149 RepID=A0A2P2LDD5_RHIMU
MTKISLAVAHILHRTVENREANHGEKHEESINPRFRFMHTEKQTQIERERDIEGDEST